MFLCDYTSIRPYYRKERMNNKANKIKYNKKASGLFCFLAAAASSLFSCQLLLLFRFSCSMQLNRRKRLSPLVASSSFVCLLKAFSFFVFVVFFSL